MKGPADDEVAAMAARGETAAAAERAFRVHGPEILGFLVATMRNEADAADVFSVFSVDVWRGIGTWRGESSLRTWLFQVARNAAARFRRTEGKKRARHTELDDASHLSKLVHEIRQSTLLHQKTETKDRVRRLREKLTADEQELLVLRIDKKLEWDDIAAIVFDDGDDVDVKKRAASLRKRFERTKEKLKKLAEDEGLLEKRS